MKNFTLKRISYIQYTFKRYFLFFQSVEAEKIEKAKVESKLAEAVQRRDAMVEEFRRASEIELQKKMESIQENRDRLLHERVEKMKEHVSNTQFSNQSEIFSNFLQILRKNMSKKFVKPRRIWFRRRLSLPNDRKITTH